MDQSGGLIEEVRGGKRSVGERSTLAAASAAGLLQRLPARSAALELRDAVRHVSSTNSAITEKVMGAAFAILKRIGAAEQQTNKAPDDANEEDENGNDVSLPIALFELLLGRYLDDDDENDAKGAQSAVVDDKSEGREEVSAAVMERHSDLLLLSTMTEKLDPLLLFGSEGGGGSLSLLRTLRRLVEHAARRVEEANLKAMEDDAARNHLVGVTTTAAAAHTAAGVGGIEVGGDNATPAELVMSREDRKIMAQVVLGNGQSVEGAAGIDGTEEEARGPGEAIMGLASLTLAIFGSALLLAPPPPSESNGPTIARERGDRRREDLLTPWSCPSQDSPRPHSHRGGNGSEIAIGTTTTITTTTAAERRQCDLRRASGDS